MRRNIALLHRRRRSWSRKYWRATATSPSCVNGYHGYSQQIINRNLSHCLPVWRNTSMTRKNAGRYARVLGAVVATAGALPTFTHPPTAGAAPCPDVEIVFARGTTEPPGVGGIGQAFVDSLRSQLGGRSVGVYAVNYPATNDFARSTPAGGDDMSAHVQAMAANCPNTRMVLGGYSQGAAVVDLATTYMPPDVADNVAAAAEFGGARSTFADSLSA